MTNRQQIIMSKVQEKIKELRRMLDDVMYCSEPLQPDEYKKIRAGYDKICEANDKLF